MKIKGMAGSLRLFVLGVLAVAASGCASSSQNYTPARNYDIVTEKTLAVPFDVAWDSYVAELSKSFFVINNISKDSRIINVSISSNKPGDFVDCGVTVRKSSHPSTGEQTFEYQTADDSRYFAGENGTNVLWQVSRNTALDGRANIYMAPQNSGTLLRVNAKYVWTVDVNGQSNVGGMFSETVSAAFSSSQPGQTDGVDPFTCTSNGTLERELLNLMD